MLPKLKDVKCILLDIEGTICPISFVKDTLFPYALKALPDLLAAKWDDEEFKPYRDDFPEAFKGSPEALRSHVEDLTKRDVKIAYLKNLQGYLWENGYKTGAYSTPLFPDVAPRLEEWKNEGLQLAIYSSGSVFAQKLLFGHVKSDTTATGEKRKRSAEKDVEITEPPLKKHVSNAEPSTENLTSVPTVVENGEPQQGEDKKAANDGLDGEQNPDKTIDLQHLIVDWFDTTNAGLKTEASSYAKIAETLGWSPSAVLFLSDNVKEVDAATQAGMQSTLVVRLGNAPVSEDDRQRLNVVNSFDEIDLHREAKKEAVRKTAMQGPKRRITRAQTKSGVTRSID